MIADRRRAIDAAQHSGELERLLFAQATLAGGLLRAGAWEEGRAVARAALALGLQNEGGNTAAGCQAELAWMEGRHSDAVREFESGLTLSRVNGDLQGVTYNLTWLVWFALELGRPADAEALAREAMTVARTEWGGIFGFVAGPFAETLARVGSPDAAAALAEAEELVDEFGLAVATPQLLRARAILHAEDGATAAALDALRTSADIARSQHEVIQLAQTLALHVSIGHDQTRYAAARAQADAERQAIVARIGPEVRGLAWAHHLPQLPGVRSQQLVSPLSPREREVAALIANGLSNRQIAHTLVISERTVENHVGSILAKLGLERRAQVATWAVQHGLEVARQ
jgi:DNA-binding NarL/FixJ family response regulator